MPIRQITTETDVVVSFDELKPHQADQLDVIGRRLLAICRTAGIERRGLLIDLHKVQFPPSPLLGVLVSVHQKAQQECVALRLANLPPAVRQVFNIARLQDVFSVVEYSSPDRLNSESARPESHNSMKEVSVERTP